MTMQQTIDQAKADAFVGKVLGDTAALAVTVMSSIGDRLGLFKNLAQQGSATSEELAERTHINERYARERVAQRDGQRRLSGVRPGKSLLHAPTRAHTRARPGRWPGLLRWRARGNSGIGRTDQPVDAGLPQRRVPMENPFNILYEVTQ